MGYDELNKYIYNYLEFDHTNRAILLKGDWGTGKSYYIENTLKPFLESAEKKYKCTVVSLFGLDDLSDISKAIYFQSRKIINEPESEAGNTAKIVGKIIGKTILNGLVSKIGFDIGSIDEKDLLKVYESIDLSHNLVIFEDVERSNIDISKIFGYVNNLCEYDHVKVMLVTNENEFVELETVVNNDKEVKKYTKKTLDYIRKKEKAIGDTIEFICDYEEAIKEILSYYIYLKKYMTNEYISEIVGLFDNTKFNLRSFIIACQKTEDLLNNLHQRDITIGTNTEKVMFYGIIGFLQKKGNAQYIAFNSRSYLSSDLGANNKYPLFRFCYDYIMFQKFTDSDSIRETTQLYVDYCKHSKWNSGIDEDLNIIKNYYIQEEKVLVKAIDNIKLKIEQGDFSFYDYGNLAKYLVLIQYESGIDTKLDDIESLMISSLKSRTDSLGIIYIFTDNNPLENKEANIRYTKFRVALEKAMAKFDDSDLMYEPESFILFCRNYSKLRYRNIGERVLFRIAPDKFMNMIKKSDSNQLNEIRTFLYNIYFIDNGYDDKILNNLQEISNWIDKESFDGFDKIQKLQMRWMKDMLDEGIQK